MESLKLLELIVLCMINTPGVHLSHLNDKCNRLTPAYGPGCHLRRYQCTAESRPPSTVPNSFPNDCTANMWKSFEKAVDTEWNSREVMFPYIINSNYIDTLLSVYCHVGDETSAMEQKEALLVGGPKDKGKSTGIFYSQNAQLYSSDY